MIAAVRVPPSACSTSQSIVTVRSPIALEVDAGAQRAADQALDLLRAAGLPAARRLARAHYAVDSSKGTLTLVGHTPSGGRTPRNITIDPTNQYLIAANQNGDNIVVFKIDSKSGSLTPPATGQVPQPGGLYLRESTVTCLDAEPQSRSERKTSSKRLRASAPLRLIAIISSTSLLSCRISGIPRRPEMSVLKKTVLLCVLAAAVVVAQGQGAKVFPPTADQKAEIHKKLAELSARLAALGSNKADPQLLADVQIYKKAVEYILRFPDEFFGANLRQRDDYRARYGHRTQPSSSRTARPHGRKRPATSCADSSRESTAASSPTD